MSGGFGSGGFGAVPFGGSTFLSGSGTAHFVGTADCAPITPSTFSIVYRDGSLVESIVAYDNGLGALLISPEWLLAFPSGLVLGTVNYRTGAVDITFTPAPAGSVGMRYESAEGGCPETCGACKTHHFRMRLIPGFDVGRNQTDVSDAYRRFIDKLNGIKPIHTDWLPTIVSDEFSIELEQDLYDVIPADVRNTDTVSVSIKFED
jgi:hypothetical protein